MDDLIKIEPRDALEIFTTGDGLNEILRKIELQANSFVANVKTAQGRKEIASFAYDIARTKTALDDMGKNLVADWKAKAKLVDISRKKARDFLDELKNNVRRPLTEFEQAEAARIQAEKDLIELEDAWNEALIENELFDRQKEIERRELEFAQKEAERLAEEQAKQARIEQIEREKRIAEEAAEKAKREAQREKALAVQQEREAAAAREKARLDIERKEAEEKARKAADIEHRRRINRDALESFLATGFSESIAKQVISYIAAGKIKHIIINY